MVKRCGRLNSFLQETTPLASPFAKRLRFHPPFGRPLCAARDGRTRFRLALQTSQTPANVSLPVWRQIYTGRGRPAQEYPDNSDDCRSACPWKEHCPWIPFRSEKRGANGAMIVAARLRAPPAANLARERRKEVQ